MRPRSTTYEGFVQRIRRHRPSDLLVALAATSVQLYEGPAWLGDRLRLPWAIAAAAKASIVAANEHRKPGVTERDVGQICQAYNALETPLTRRPQGTSESVGAFLVRTFYEQFIFQQSYFEEISRAAALFEEVDPVETEILDETLIKGLLGCTLGEFVVAGFILATSTHANSGFFDPGWASLREGAGAIDPHFSIDIVRDVFCRHFLTDFAQIRETARNHAQSDRFLQALEYNPLAGRPFVTLPDGRHLAPQPHYIYQRLSTAGIYYTAVEQLNAHDAKAFTRDIGNVFEHYVGRQLKLIRNAAVHPEIGYGKGNGQKSVDWFVTFDDLVVLVEAKSTRLSQLARMGGSKLEGDIARSIGKAFSQIERTNQLLTEQHPAFAAIPSDRPRIGLITTLEPYWGINSPFVEAFLPQPTIPTSVCSIRELERLVDVLGVVGNPEPLTAVLQDRDRRHWNLENALPDIETPKNPILDAAWKRYPFPSTHTPPE